MYEVPANVEISIGKRTAYLEKIRERLGIASKEAIEAQEKKLFKLRKLEEDKNWILGKMNQSESLSKEIYNGILESKNILKYDDWEVIKIKNKQEFSKDLYEKYVSKKTGGTYEEWKAGIDDLAKKRAEKLNLKLIKKSGKWEFKI